MKTIHEVKKGLECCLGQYSASCGKCPYSNDGKDCGRNGVQIMKDALVYIQTSESSYSQVSKALCGKQNATLEELLQGASQVKAELESVNRERVALERDFKSFANCTHNVCHYCASNSDFDCGKCWCRYPEAFVWRGVCPENTEVD